ncbi:MAG: hypothetical protein RBS39_09790 [Phycisphaerales bacterium]|jgi:hypothetical protein|nr:hypothetical protein [Phycisphaerales bacterium]
MNPSLTVERLERSELAARVSFERREAESAYFRRARERALRLLASLGLVSARVSFVGREPAWSEEARLASARAGGERPEWWRSRPPGA